MRRTIWALPVKPKHHPNVGWEDDQTNVATLFRNDQLTCYAYQEVFDKIPVVTVPRAATIVGCSVTDATRAVHDEHQIHISGGTRNCKLVQNNGIAQSR